MHLDQDAFDEEDRRRAREEIPFVDRVVPTFDWLPRIPLLWRRILLPQECLETSRPRDRMTKEKGKAKLMLAKAKGQFGFGPGWSGLRTFLWWEC